MNDTSKSKEREAAETEFPDDSPWLSQLHDSLISAFRNCFIKGANWQQQTEQPSHISGQGREAELEKCLGEAVKVMSDLKEDCRYVTWGEDETHFENTKDWEVLCNAITKAKSLLNS